MDQSNKYLMMAKDRTPIVYTYEWRGEDGVNNSFPTVAEGWTGKNFDFEPDCSRGNQ